jgi:hypothetical protein
MPKITYTYEYSPYHQVSDGSEIPAFEILNEDWDKVADTNECQSVEVQESVARLFAASPELLWVLESAGEVDWVHNAAITNDIESLRRICLQFGEWWNQKALPAIALAKGSD